MIKLPFNEKWTCCQTGKEETAFAVSLPHDAMLLDEKKDGCPGGVNNGWIDAKDYTYQKTFVVPENWKGRETVFYFEGVYHMASVFLNGKKAAFHHYGYTGFYVNATEYLEYGKENTIKVEAVNSNQPNSRWYSGTGIYRPVWICHMPKQHICLQGIRITTLDYQKPRIQVEVKTTDCGQIKVEILEYNKNTGKNGSLIAEAEETTQGVFRKELELKEAKLWDTETPNLYTCRVTYGEDVQEERFGIRMISLDREKGFLLNGKRVILKGACVHHDNGLLGACAYDFAEYRKVRLLKENGYNAIRSAHNPCSEAMLRACDELGVLMVDEYVDEWYIHKTQNDYADLVEKNFREDLKCLADRDYNHPSVIMYSTGNEVAETAQKRGIQLCKEMTDQLHAVDGTRPVTCGINIFFNFLSSMGFGVYSDKKAAQAAKDVKKKKAVGSEFFNMMAGIMGADFMKFGATLYPCDLKTKNAFAKMDAAGYNYGIKRYRHDLKKYPNRMILGSETFCSDAYRFWELAKRNPRIIGDFVWAGIDYLGEVGIGSWEYKEYASNFNSGKGWVAAGSGRIDLTGKPLAEMTYTKVAFEQEKIGIGVVPVPYAGKKHSPSAWKMSNAIESWSWNGCSGKKTKVEVYARAHHVSLFVNEKCVGTKKIKNDCMVSFHTAYRDGAVRAVAYDEQGKVLAEKELKTAGNKTRLTVKPELDTVCRNGDLCYVRLQYTDENGTVKPLERGKIRIKVEGGRLLGYGSACPFYERSYLSDVADTYYGEAMAIILPGEGEKIRILAESKYGKGSAQVKVVDR